MIYDYDDCYRVQKETTNKEEAWSFYLSKYREIIFEKLDEYYKICNKKPKSIRKNQTTNLVNPILRPVFEFLIGENESNKQKSNKIKI